VLTQASEAGKKRRGQPFFRAYGYSIGQVAVKQVCKPSFLRYFSAVNMIIHAILRAFFFTVALNRQKTLSLGKGVAVRLLAPFKKVSM